MKSIQNLLRATEKNQQLKPTELSKVKGGTSTIVETMVEVTTNISGVTCILYCDRRRRTVGG